MKAYKKITFNRKKDSLFMEVGIASYNKNKSEWKHLFSIPLIGVFFKTPTELVYERMKDGWL